MRKRTRIMLAMCLPFIGQAQSYAETSETLRVWMDNITITADGETITKLTVYENDVQDYASFNLSLNVPVGVRIAQVSAGRGKVKNDIELSERATDGHTITCNQPSETLIKVSCISMEGDNFYPDDEGGNPIDELFTIGLVADPSTVNGTYTITLGDLDFGLIIDSDGNMADVTMKEWPTFEMTITGGQDELTVPYVLPSVGVGTLCLPFDAEIPEGLAVYTAQDVKGLTVELSEQTSIAAGTPLIVTGKPGNYTFKGAPTASGATFSVGLLTGVMTATTISSGYVLQSQDDVTGFYKVNAEKPVTVPANRCWLTFDDGVGATMLRIDLKTGVESIVSQNKDEWFDLSGRNAKPDQTGVYIKNGKKQVVKH